MDGLPLGALINGQVGAAAVLAIMALLVITDKLVWYKRLAKVEEERDQWRQIALSALGVADKMTVHAEVANEVLTRLPDPATEERDPA